MNKIILFPRGKTTIAATIIKTVLEPLDTGNGRQVVFFCQDKTGQRYRVPKSEVIAIGARPIAAKPKGKKARGKKCKKSMIAI